MSAAELHHLLGAYVLGGLDSADSQRFEAHLQECADCRAELAELESLPALLDALPVPDAVGLTGNARHAAATQPATSVPRALLTDLAARRRKSRRRWVALVGAVAAACLALGVAAGPLLNRPPQPDASYSVQADSGLRFSVDLARKNWGTELAVNGTSMPLNGTYSLWVRDRDGGEDRACAWTATPSGRIKITGATPVQLASIASVELRDDAEHPVAVITVP
ncbi:zf-HC2 domain-containing protein [Pseudarthrobacter sulfonivorans]|uniref:anti-sigma factor n=1 Tax=Pseudarthrobacter sulfonivorans TaxID=121292 RepID=UPI0028543937|nr:zf-HC2 domain-containing protein [Pseudarthrobacter sulfonivorans]MDR6416484.1 anti-sigma-K factor RskA [Pseudarthrobacter sulfonivorans]